MRARSIAVRILIGCAAGTLASGAAAQGAPRYPAKPIRLIVPFAQGGASDYVARMIENRFSALAGQDIVIENRPGASGNVGVEAAAKAAADGYALLLGNAAVMAMNPALYRGSLRTVPIRDFVPITQIADLPSALVAHPSVPSKSARELIAYAKARPAKLTFASAGPASADRLEMELFMKSSGARLVHRPYKEGVAPAVKAVLAGEAHVMFVPLSTVAGEVRGGKLRLLALAAPRRMDAFPAAATLEEQGVPDMVSGAWQGVFAPKGTPPAIVAKLHATLVQVMASPRVKFHLNGAGVEVVTSKSPQEFARFLRAETERWTQVANDSGARP